MVERFLGFLDRPMSRDAAKAVIILAAAVCLGYIMLALLSIGTDGDAQPGAGLPGARRTAVPARSARSGRDPAVSSVRQDPQDRPGSAAARAVRGDLQTHRALQHVPYRGAGVTITLVGARDGRALLSVRGDDLETERRGWRRFLRRFGDDGSAYDPIFSSGRGGAASGRSARKHVGRAGVAFDHPFGLRFDQLFDLPFGGSSRRTRLVWRHAADCAGPILRRSLRHSEVGT